MFVTDATARRIQAEWDRLSARDRARDPLARMAEIQADMEHDHQERLRRWEQQRPQREQAAAAHRAATERRRAELGLGAHEPFPIFATLWAEPPMRPRVR